MWVRVGEWVGGCKEVWEGGAHHGTQLLGREWGQEGGRACG